MIVYQAIIVLWALSEIVIGVTHDAPPQEPHKDRSSGYVMVGFLVVSVWAGYFAGRAAPQDAITQGRVLVFATGALLALAGIALRWYAVMTLGRFFTTRVMTRSGQTVVERGPYRLVRHPSYSGALLTVLGILMMSTNWLSLACFVLALPGVAYRVAVEERALVEGLGEPYRDYMRRTKRLVPFVV